MDLVGKHYNARAGQPPSATTNAAWLRVTHLGGPNPTGNRFKCRMAAYFEFDDQDLMTLERVYYDQTTINNQLQGLVQVEDD